MNDELRVRVSSTQAQIYNQLNEGLTNCWFDKLF